MIPPCPPPCGVGYARSDLLLDGIELERGRLRAIRTELIDDRLQVRLEVVVLAHSTPYYERARRFLIEDVRQMRDDDFERLYAAEAQGLFGFLVYRTGDRALAEDLLADTFERALRSRKRYDRRRGPAKAWLYAIALNLLRDHVRRAAAAERALERTGPAATSVDPPPFEARDEVQRALRVLSPEEREAIALRFGAELTVPEMAEALGEPLTTVEGRVYRALRKLRTELDG